MGALFSRIKNWTSTEDVTNTDLNAEFDNILNNLDADQLGDYSSNASEMQTSIDPGEVGSESLATSVAGEIERIRFVLKEIKGDVAQWYTTGATSLSEISAALGTSLDGNRVASGPVYTGSQQPLYLIPDGTAASAVLAGGTTNVVYYVNGAAVTVSTNLAITPITTAPSTNNTATVNDVSVADGEDTKWLGEYGTTITIDNVGSEITSLVGNLAAFKINNGSTDEYFIARVDSSTTLTEARRGYFFNSSSAPVPRIAIADNDTITLLKLNWIFGKSDGTVARTTNEPKWQSDEPSSPATDDYWFDITNNTWKRYNGASFISADATFLGILVADATNCIGGRSLEYAGEPVRDMSLDLLKVSATTVRGRHNSAELGVHDTTVKFKYDAPEWDITADLESGLTEQSSTMYYLYVTETGDTVISDKIPSDREADLGGYYHPHHLWRCAGQVYNDASSNLEEPQTFQRPKQIFPDEHQKIVSITSVDSSYTVPELVESVIIDGTSDDITVALPPANTQKGRTLKLKRIDQQYKDWPTFADSDVTTGTENINITSHGLADLEKVQVSNSGGALPTGLSASTDYWVIYVDADNFKLASSRANAVADTAVDITAASGGGTHTIEVQKRTVTIDGDGSETIDGATTKKMMTQYEMMEISCDGTEWHIVNRNTDTPWSAGSALIFSGTTTAPTKGTTATDEFFWKREGASVRVRFAYRQTGAGDAGSGDYLIEAIPKNTTIDSTYISFYTTVEGAGAYNLSNVIGSGMTGGSATESVSSLICAYSTVYVRILGTGPNSTGAAGSGFQAMNNATINYHGEFIAPITDWDL